MSDRARAPDPWRPQFESELHEMVNAHSGVNCCNSHGDSGRGDLIDNHAYLGPATTAPTESRAAVDGEHGGFGLKVPDHMWFGDGSAYEMEPDSATLTRRYVENQTDVLRSARQCGISRSVYTEITDFYPLDGSAEDAVGNNDAILQGGATFVPGKNGEAVALNGSGQYVDTGAALLDTSENYTAGAWVKLNKADGAFQTFVSQDGDRDSAFFLQYSGQDQRFAMSFPGIRALSPTKPNPG